MSLLQGWPGDSFSSASVHDSAAGMHGLLSRKLQTWMASTHQSFGRKLGQQAKHLEVNFMGVETSMQGLLSPSLLEHACELPKTHFTQKRVLLLVLKCLTLHWLSFGVTPHLPSPCQNTEFCLCDQQQY